MGNASPPLFRKCSPLFQFTFLHCTRLCTWARFTVYEFMVTAGLTCPPKSWLSMLDRTSEPAKRSRCSIDKWRALRLTVARCNHLQEQGAFCQN